MGLDNSILFRFWRKGCRKDSRVIEVCYWRKYWNLRNEVLTELEDSFINRGESECLIPSDNASFLEGFETILKKYCNVAYCENCNMCPWDATEQAYHNRNELNKLQFLIDFVNGEITAEILFRAAQCWDKFHFKDEFFSFIEDGEIEYEIEFIDSY